MRWVMAAGLILLTTGCVGKGKYNALMRDYEALVRENEQMATDLEACQERRRQKRPSPRRVNER